MVLVCWDNNGISKIIIDHREKSNSLIIQIRNDHYVCTTKRQGVENI